MLKIKVTSVYLVGIWLRITDNEEFKKDRSQFWTVILENGKSLIDISTDNIKSCNGFGQGTEERLIRQLQKEKKELPFLFSEALREYYHKIHDDYNSALHNAQEERDEAFKIIKGFQEINGEMTDEAKPD